MLSGNGKQFEIWLNLEDPFDYKTFESRCKSDGVVPMQGIVFAQKAGMIMCGISAYPELPVKDAYLKFINNNKYETDSQDKRVGCGTCGGGEVR